VEVYVLSFASSFLIFVLQANTEKPSLSRSEQAGRNALLSDITKGKKLKKTVTNDRSAPILDSKYDPTCWDFGRHECFHISESRKSFYISSDETTGGGRPPVLPPEAAPPPPSPSPRERPAALPGRPQGRAAPPGPAEEPRATAEADAGSKPEATPPPVPARPGPSLHPAWGPRPALPGSRGAGDGAPPAARPGRCIPLLGRPPCLPLRAGRRRTSRRPHRRPGRTRPATAREASLPRRAARTANRRAAAPPPSAPRHPAAPGRPGPPPSAAPARNISLGSCPAPSPGRSGPLPHRPARGRRRRSEGDPPGRSGPLPPPPPISRNGSTSRALPATPQLPSRAGLDSQRGGARPPLPPDRPGSAAPPPPPPPSAAVRNGFQDPGDDEWESRFSFHPISDLPPPEPYVPMNRSYPSKLARNESRGKLEFQCIVLKSVDGEEVLRFLNFSY
uniref:WAS/WASL interacting protein family member 1 n=1 Tax=Malurus cyaneus samueli TaxID=2593467 RepID=A0A8C5XAM7_9PASS